MSNEVNHQGEHNSAKKGYIPVLTDSLKLPVKC
jgi:hypothetical protein